MSYEYYDYPDNDRLERAVSYIEDKQIEDDYQAAFEQTCAENPDIDPDHLAAVADGQDPDEFDFDLAVAGIREWQGAAEQHGVDPYQLAEAANFTQGDFQAAAQYLAEAAEPEPPTSIGDAIDSFIAANAPEAA